MKQLAWMLVMTALLAGCGQVPLTPLAAGTSPVSARALADDLYPVAPGTTWTYATRSRVEQEPWRAGLEQRFWITEASATATATVAVMERRFGDRPMAPTRIVRTGTEVRLSRHLRPEDGSLMVLRLPPVPGDSWAGRRWAQAAETVQVLERAPLTVPAGSYQAVRTEHHIRYADGREDVLAYWYAPGLGLVKAVEALSMDLGQGLKRYEVVAELKGFAQGSRESK